MARARPGGLDIMRCSGLNGSWWSAQTARGVDLSPELTRGIFGRLPPGTFGDSSHMIGCIVRRQPALFGWGVVMLVLAIAGPLAGQEVADDSSATAFPPPTTEFSVPGEAIDQLPLDRPEEALL